MKSLSTIFCLCLPLFAFDNGDIQSWNNVSFSKKVTAQSSLYLSEQAKLRSDFAELFLHRTDLGLRIELNKFIEFSLNYKQVNIMNGGSWRKSSVPYSGIIWEFFPKWAEIQTRQLLELWLPGTENPYVRYRHKIRVYPDVGKKLARLQPYVAEEFFWYFNEKGWGNMRSYAGISVSFLGNGELGIYYCLHQKDTAGGWKNNHVFGTSLSFEI